MEETGVPYSERELIQRAINNAKPFAFDAPRWCLVKRVFGTGAHVSRAICWKYGFDPDKDVPSLMTDDFER
jgi:ribosomal protein S13